jgi:hypothetical protein
MNADRLKPAEVFRPGEYLRDELEGGLLHNFTTKLVIDESNALFEHLLHQGLIRLEFCHRVVYCLGLC